MSTVGVLDPPVEQAIGAPLPRRLDHTRGTGGMWLVIATEAMLFAVLFTAYFMLARGGPRWLEEHPPKLPKAIVMLVVLTASSFVLTWGERGGRRGAAGRVVAGAWAAIVLGAAFLAIQGLEYADHLKTLTPQSNAYGSLFYTITSIHGIHVLVGLLMLLYLLAVPGGPRTEERAERRLKNAGLYWHFVDIVWVFIVALLYVLPNLR